MDDTAAATLFACLDREIWLVTARAGERRGGLIATFVSQASLPAEEPRVLIGIARQHHTWGLIEESGRFALHLLSEDDVDLVWRFGLKSGRGLDKFAGLETTESPGGCPLVAATVGWMDCRVETKLDAGDRTTYLAEVVESQVRKFAPALTMRRLMERAPSHYLLEMQRNRHLDGNRDAEAIRAWRAQRE